MIHYIGCDDPSLDLFESQYQVPAGMCYNSYYIADEHPAIMDTVDQRCADAWKAKLQAIVAQTGRTPEYLVVHHMEPDHSALIAWTLSAYPELKLVASAQALKMLPQFFEGIQTEGRTLPVKEGSHLSLGQHELCFIGAPMIHWPEVMVSYDAASKTLFSADAFGKFGTYDADRDDWACEARRYYFNICGKYGTQVQALLKKVAAAGELQTVCPLHGPILSMPETGGQAAGRYEPLHILPEALRLYDIWSRYAVETEGVFIAHASIHGGTKAAAERLAEILQAKGCPKVATSDLTRDDMAEAIEDAFRYGRMVVCASSYDASVFPPMHAFLHKLQLKAYQQRRVAIVENGTWAPTAGRVMRDMLSQMKQVEIVEPMLTLRSRLHSDQLPLLEQLADAILA